MKNQTLHKRIITAFAILMGMLFVLSDLVAQEGIRRGMRGGSMSESDPGNLGGADPLDEGRAEGGRPDNPFSQNPGSGGDAGGQQEPKGDGDPSGGPVDDDPFTEEKPNGEGGPSEGEGGEDPFMEEKPDGEGGPDGGAGGDDPFIEEKPDGGEGAVCSVILYGRPSCGLCKATKSALDDENIVFVEKNIDSDSGASEEMWEHVQKTDHGGGSIALPVVVANGKVFLNPTNNLGDFIKQVKDACTASKK